MEDVNGELADGVGKGGVGVVGIAHHVLGPTLALDDLDILHHGGIDV